MGDLPAAGWYPDPEDASQQRYWDGQQWTDHRAPAAGSGEPSWPSSPPAQGGYVAQGGGPAYGGGYGAGQNPAANVNTWLWQSIVATLFCCLPAGVAGIVFAAQANSAKGAGDLATAQEKARLARIWTLVSVGVGVVVILVFFVFGVFGAVMDSQTTGF